MRQILLIFANLIETLPMAILFTIGEMIYVFLHAALHRGVPTYWITAPVTWPATLFAKNFSSTFIPEEFGVVLLFFVMLLNTMILILLFKILWRKIVKR